MGEHDDLLRDIMGEIKTASEGRDVHQALRDIDALWNRLDDAVHLAEARARILVRRAEPPLEATLSAGLQASIEGLDAQPSLTCYVKRLIQVVQHAYGRYLPPPRVKLYPGGHVVEVEWGDNWMCLVYPPRLPWPGLSVRSYGRSSPNERLKAKSHHWANGVLEELGALLRASPQGFRRSDSNNHLTLEHLQARLDELGALKKGWLDGEGEPLDESGLEELTVLLKHLCLPSPTAVGRYLLQHGWTVMERVQRDNWVWYTQPDEGQPDPVIVEVPQLVNAIDYPRVMDTLLDDLARLERRAASDIMGDIGHIPIPYLYPTPQGAVQAEWSTGFWDVELTCNLRTGDVALSADNTAGDQQEDRYTRLRIESSAFAKMRADLAFFFGVV